MSIVFKRQNETWSKHASFSSKTATVNFLAYNDDESAITIDAAQLVGAAPAIGDQLDSRPLYAKEITWGQTTPAAVTAVVKYDSTLFIPSAHSETAVQSVEEDVSGYVNSSLGSTTYDVSWWRYRNPTAWVYGLTYPWTTAEPTEVHQQRIVAGTSYAVDAGGTPLKRPILGQQLTVTLTFTSKPTALRNYWRSIRGCRNDAAFLGDDIGTWLFTGASQRASASDTLYHVELSFYRDPFGWCRQRPQSGPNGVFRKDVELVEIDAPSATTCGGTEKIWVASCVNWVQLHPCLDDFSDLFTTEQLAQLVDLVG